MFNFSKLIHSTFKSNYPITVVKTAGTYADGKYQPAVSVPYVISGSCTNMSGRDLKLLPEGFRFENSRQLFTTEEIPVDTDIEYRGKRYKVILSDYYDDIQQSGHWKAVLKLYAKGYNNAGETTVREPVLETVTPPPNPMGGQYINGVWTDD